MGHVIGIDVGFQSVQGILLFPEAETLGVASAACAMTNAAPGWADQNPSAWGHGAEQVVRRLISAVGSCNLMRGRFSVADPASFLGILDEASVDRLVGGVAALGTLP